MYLPRRSTAATVSPSIRAATSCGSSGRVNRASSMRADAMRLPSIRAASRPRSVSTSGSSGTDDVEDERMGGRRRVGDLVGGDHRFGYSIRRRLVTRVDLGEGFAVADLVAALLHADDADRV